MPRTVAHQAPRSMGFSRQEYWSGLPFPSPGDLPDPGIETRYPSLQADALTTLLFIRFMFLWEYRSDLPTQHFAENIFQREWAEMGTES